MGGRIVLTLALVEQRENGLELYPGMELGQSAVTNGTRVLITNPVSLMSR